MSGTSCCAAAAPPRSKAEGAHPQWPQHHHHTNHRPVPARRLALGLRCDHCRAAERRQRSSSAARCSTVTASRSATRCSKPGRLPPRPPTPSGDPGVSPHADRRQRRVSLRTAATRPALQGEPLMYLTLFARGVLKHQFSAVFLEDDAGARAVRAARAGAGERRDDVDREEDRRRPIPLGRAHAGRSRDGVLRLRVNRSASAGAGRFGGMR